VLSGEAIESGCYVKPAIAEAKNSFAIGTKQAKHLRPYFYLLRIFRKSKQEALALQKRAPRIIISYYDKYLRKLETFSFYK